MPGDDGGALNLQDLAHGADHDYAVGSPHLAHPALNRWMVERTTRKVTETFARCGQARVLEIGAGHGAFTDHVLAMGATVTVTEMSAASAATLAERYRHNPAAHVVHDPSGDLADLEEGAYDLVLAVAVLHHIPDYLDALTSWTRLIGEDGGFLSFQDPLWYPRQGRLRTGIDRGAYYLWRVGRGDLLNGARSFARRSRGAMDDTNPRDMVEYHVLRDGCDEEAIAALLRPHFDSVEVLPYWSTAAAPLQSLGRHAGLVSDFGIDATGRHRPA